MCFGESLARGWAAPVAGSGAMLSINTFWVRSRCWKWRMRSVSLRFEEQGYSRGAQLLLLVLVLAPALEDLDLELEFCLPLINMLQWI